MKFGLSLVLILFCTSALGLTCKSGVLSTSLEDNLHIFVARVTTAEFLPSVQLPSAYHQLWDGEVRGFLEILDVIKGNPEFVPYLSTIVPRTEPCGGCSASTVDVGYIYLVFAKNDGPVAVGDCSITRRQVGIHGQCAGYRYRVENGLDASDPDQCEAWLESELFVEAYEREEWTREHLNSDGKT